MTPSHMQFGRTDLVDPRIILRTQGTMNHMGRSLRQDDVVLGVPLTLWLGLLYLLGYYGFPCQLITLFAVGLGNVTRPFSIVYHACHLSICMLLLCSAIFRDRIRQSGGINVAIIVFWCLLTLRIISDGFLFPKTLIEPVSLYYVFPYGVTFIPMFLFAVPLSQRAQKYAFWGFLLPLIVVCLFACALYHQYFGMSYRSLQYQGEDTSRLATNWILSYPGSMLAAVSIWGLLTRRIRTTHAAWMCVAGLICMFLGSNRGALVTFVACVLFALAFTAGTRRHAKWVAAVVVLVLSVVVVKWVGGGAIESTVIAISEAQAGEDTAGSGRMLIWRRSVQQFLESPVFGSGLEEQVSGGYPHNHILQAFMATGVFGGALYVSIVISGLRRAARLMKERRELGWISLIYVQAVAMGLVSGDITTFYFWFPLVAIHANTRTTVHGMRRIARGGRAGTHGLVRNPACQREGNSHVLEVPAELADGVEKGARN